MNKILVIGFFYSSKESTGSVRIQGIVKNLRQFGWEPIVLAFGQSESNDDFKVIRVPCDDLRDVWKHRLGLKPKTTVKQQLGMSDATEKGKGTTVDGLLRAWEELLAYPDLLKLWRKPAVEAGLNIIRQDKIDLIFSTSPPVTVNLVARDLSSKSGLPWIADFRDLWTQNPYYPYHSLRKGRERRLERRILSKADALITVSKPLATDLSSMHGGRPVETVENGFDPQTRSPAAKLTEKLSIIHAGQMYWGKRDPAPFFDAVKTLIDNGNMDPKDLDIRFYGFEEGWLNGEIEKFSLESIVRNLGIVSRDEIIKLEKESQLLLLLTWNNPSERGVYTGKIFEYLAACRPILATGMHGSVVEDLIRSASAGSFASTKEEVMDSLMQAYREFKSTGRVAYNGKDSVIDRYSHREMTKRIASIFDAVLESHSGRPK